MSFEQQSNSISEQNRDSADYKSQPLNLLSLSPERGNLALASFSRPTNRGNDAGTGEQLPALILLKGQTDEAARNKQVDKVAGDLADFIGGARSSLDIAIYHFQLRGDAEKKVVDALNDRAEHGVKVRLAIFEAEQKNGITEDNSEAAAAGAAGGADPRLIAKLNPKIETHKTQQGRSEGALADDLQRGIETEGIRGGGKLMHHKYIVRDGGTQAAAVWTGSTNFTDDAFGSQDNNIIQFKSKELASAFEEDFQQLWDKGAIAGTGKDLNQTVKVGDSSVTVAFSPGDGALIDSEIASRIEAAKQCVHIASMDISSQKILKALSSKIDEGIPVDGIYDGPQMNVVEKAWGRSSSEASQEKMDLWNKVKTHLVAKHSHPYRPGQLADFMHNKTVEIDDKTVITGSFNFSSNATHNAENIVIVDNPGVAKQYGDYINKLSISYGGMRK